ncbi:hypothetical protein F5146DRAFT_1037590 [Armillaria mellea]|nr:hypothetical protein F5146DRAFT_1037590 [Armillaria mellea]
MAHVRLDMIAADSLLRPRLDRIKELESELARLRTEVDFLSLALDRYYSFHAPIRRLPPEMLLSIFGHLESDPTPHRDDAPWLLIRVCSSWRDLVTHTPMLWSTIKIDCPYNYWDFTETQSSTLSLLASSLRYSKNAPLDITLISDMTHPSMDCVATLLSEHSNRWCSVLFDSDLFMPNDLPVLERLDLWMSSGLFETLQAPRLHTLILRKLPSITFSRFPALRCLECSIADIEQFIHLLETARQLTALRVDYQEFPVHKDLPSSSLTSNLLELHLPIEVPEVLSWISFPLLQPLTLGHPLADKYGYKTEDVGILNTLHCPRLRTLILNDPINILSFRKLLLCPITHLDLAIRSESVYSELISKPLLHLQDLRITDKSLWSEGMLSLVKAKKSLRNLKVKTPSVERLRELFRKEAFPEELTISFSAY